MAQQWLTDCVIEGLQMLLTLRLKNTPASDTIAAVLKVWLAVLNAKNPNWQQERDVPRLQSAFLTVAGNQDTWPAPLHVWNALPGIPDVQRLEMARTPPPPEALAKLAALKAQYIKSIESKPEPRY